MCLLRTGKQSKRVVISCGKSADDCGYNCDVKFLDCKNQTKPKHNQNRTIAKLKIRTLDRYRKRPFKRIGSAAPSPHFLFSASGSHRSQGTRHTKAEGSAHKNFSSKREKPRLVRPAKEKPQEVPFLLRLINLQFFLRVIVFTNSPLLCHESWYLALISLIIVV